MSALTTGQIALCAMLFGAGVGTGVVAPKVQRAHKAKPAVSRPAPAKANHIAKHTKQSAPASAPAILDCPLIGSPFAADPNTIALPASLPNRLGSGTPEAPPGVWGVWPAPPPPANFLPPIPEPDAWIMLVSGLGLVGMSARRRRVA